MVSSSGIPGTVCPAESTIDELYAKAAHRVRKESAVHGGFKLEGNWRTLVTARGTRSEARALAWEGKANCAVQIGFSLGNGKYERLTPNPSPFGAP